MNKTLKSALFVVLAALVISTAFVVDRSGGGLQLATAAAPEDHTPWTTPVNVTASGSYDNYPAIGAAPSTGAVTVFWGRATEDQGLMMQSSNTILGGPLSPEVVHVGQVSLNGGPEVASDILGRRHLLYWNWDSPDTLRNWYARIGLNGRVELREEIPGTGDGGIRKLLGISVDNNLNVHMAFARNNVYESFEYYQRSEAGAWNAYEESIPAICGPADIDFEVTTQGVPMAIWKDCAQSGQGSDIYTARRVAVNDWVVENISAACCSYCPGGSGAYLPNLSAAPDGGLRASWSDGRCAGYLEDIYYREWVPGTGWDNQPIVRVAFNSGSSYFNDITVDATGVAHIVWADDTSSPFAYYRTFYVHGRGTSFSGIAIPFAQWAGGAWTREVAADSGGSAVHVAFATNKGDPDKENYYSYTMAGPPPTPTATPTPIPPPCAQQPFKDVCPPDYFYTPVMELSQQGIINGYTSSPPCPNALWVNCFLPYNGATRAQMAKIVALAANLPSGGSTQAFEDVPPTNTFFTFVQSAHAAGVISGYACGGINEPCVPPTNRPYFRPGNGVTRGQVSKMVTTAFGFNEPIPGTQWSFQDVPPGHTFHVFVERMFTRGIITGYPCGGAGEPCVPPPNRPYFRPNNPVTRGQTAKIVHESALQAAATATSTSEPTAEATPTVEESATPTVEVTATSTLEPTSTPTLVIGAEPLGP